MSEQQKIIRGGGFDLLTSDPVVIAVVRRCAELEDENRQLKRQEVARFKTLRRDVRQIKNKVFAA